MKKKTQYTQVQGSRKSVVYDHKNRYLLCQINETLTLLKKNKMWKRTKKNIFPKEYSTFQFTRTENDNNREYMNPLKHFNILYEPF
jgi:adenine-specific DNA methylase